MLNGQGLYMMLEAVRNVMRRVGNAVLIGDSGYGIMPRLMTFYSKPANHVERTFNKLLAKECIIVKNTFG